MGNLWSARHLNRLTRGLSTLLDPHVLGALPHCAGIASALSPPAGLNSDVVDQRLLVRFSAARSDSMRPAMDRICVGVALPVRSALPAMLASALVGGFSGVVFLAILVLPFEGSTYGRVPCWRPRALLA